MIGNYIESLYNIALRNKKVIKKYKQFLKAGRYRSNCAGNIVCHVQHKSVAIGTYDEKIRGVLANVLYPLTVCFQYKVPLSEDKTSFKGEQILISSSGKEIKIFSYDKKRILTRYESPEKMQKITKARKFFSKFFPEVPYVCYNMEDQSIEEELLETSAYELDAAIRFIFSDYAQYIRIAEKKYENKTHIYDRFEVDFGISVSSSIKENICSIVTHGDLWSSNILRANDKYYMIDYEHVGFRHFYYDFFCLIFHEMFINDNDFFIKK